MMASVAAEIKFCIFCPNSILDDSLRKKFCFNCRKQRKVPKFTIPKEANTEDLVKKYRKMIEYCYNCGIKVAKIEGKIVCTDGCKLLNILEKDPLELKALCTLKKAMEEGWVCIKNMKIVLCGPPCVGKTAFKSLLFNKEAPLVHNSTPIARPVQAIERIKADKNVWKEIVEQDLLQMLSNAVLLQKSNDANPPTTPTTVSTTTTDTSDNELLSTQAATTSTTPLLPTGDSNYYSKEILDYLTSKTGQPDDTTTWIHLLDSGGQPQFADMVRLFMRGRLMYIIVMKVTESLNDKPTFTYSINGKVLSTPRELRMTNLQIIKSFVESAAASGSTIQTIGGKKISSQPVFAIVASHCDKSKFYKQLLGLEETLKQKNAELRSCLSEFLHLFVFYKKGSNELIFPVNNLCEKKDREELSAEIRQHIMSQFEEIGFSVNIPIRWYIFEIKMKKTVSMDEHGILSLDLCNSIGSKLGMSESDVKECLIYLDSVTLCIYYPDLLPHVVFTKPQFLVDSLSNIVRASFVNNLRQILPEGVILSNEAHLVFKRDGVFDEAFLESLGLTFIPSRFSKSDLITLLQHFRFISPIKGSNDEIHRYFMPLVLSPDQLSDDERKGVFNAPMEPLLITFKTLVVQGLFPTLIVSLLNRQEKPLFFIDSRSPLFKRQLRHTIKLYSEDLSGSVILVDKHKFIEVYFTGKKEKCFQLREVILEALSDSVKALQYDEKTLGISATTYCRRKHMSPETDDKPHSIQMSIDNLPDARCSIESDLPDIKLDKKQLYWLMKSYSQRSNSVSHLPNILPEEKILDESYIAIILQGINKINYDWEILGTFLGIEQHVLKEISSNCQRQVAVCCKDMISEWLATGKATRENLLSAVGDMGRNDVAATIKNNIPTA